MMFDTPEKIAALRLISLKSALSIFVKTNGKMLASRGLNGTRLRTLASQYTGRTYKRNLAGAAEALADVTRLVDQLH